MAKTSVKICSEKCEYFKRFYRPYYGDECLFNNNGYYKETKYGKYCTNFKMRLSEMFKMRSKTEVVSKYIELLKKEGKTLEDLTKIELLEWILKIETNKEGVVKYNAK